MELFKQADQISEKFANFVLNFSMISFLFTSIGLIICEAIFYYMHDGQVDWRKLHLPFRFR